MKNELFLDKLRNVSRMKFIDRIRQIPMAEVTLS